MDIEIVKLFIEVGLLTGAGALLLLAGYRGLLFLEELARAKLINSHHEAMDRRDEITPKVETILHDTRLAAGNADCCFTMEKHNGTVSVGGLAFMFMTCYYEVVDGKWQSNKESRERMPLSRYHTLVRKIKDEDYLVLDADKRIEGLEPVVYATLENWNIHRSIFVKLQNVDGLMIGFLGLDYGEEKTNKMREDDLTENIKIAKEAASRIGTLLSLEIADIKARRKVFNR